MLTAVGMDGIQCKVPAAHIQPMSFMFETLALEHSHLKDNAQSLNSRLLLSSHSL